MTMKYYIIFGPPGAGKGTQSYLLADKFNLKHISTGDLLRREIERKTDLGKLAKSLIDKGQFVDDSIVLEMIKQQICFTPGEISGYIFDGYPRNIDQAKALDDLLTAYGKKVDAVISLVVDDKLIIQRIQHRAKIEDRADDMDLETIKCRIRTYHKKTEPLISYYKERDKYFPVNGEGEIEENFLEICKIINKINNE